MKLVYNGKDLVIPPELLPDGKPLPHHFQSTVGDNLIELAGRICYDSCKSTTKTRGSKEYHEHINEVRHGSVQCHLNTTVRIYSHNIWTIICSLINRPGFYVDIPTNINTTSNPYLDITYNIRAVNDWHKFQSEWEDEKLYNTLWHWANHLAPFATIPKSPGTMYQSEIVSGRHPRSIWLGFHIDKVSRNLTHEWVRHGFSTAISQRSSRFVDESDSEWIWHPLIQKYRRDLNLEVLADLDDCSSMWNIQEIASSLYEDLVEAIQMKLEDSGVDKFTARKQSRGAARGVLGGALATEMIWSASLWEIKEIISQRANAGADAEIRVLANNLYEIVQPLYPDYLKATKSECPDGIGYQVNFVEAQ